MRSFQQIAEYHELFMCDAWETLLANLERAVPTTPSHVVELGAGSGVGTVRLAERWPHARFTLVEPDPVMRAMLFARLSSVPGLLQRINVLPFAVTPATAEEIARHVGKADLILAAHMIQILSAEERQAVFSLMRECLDAGIAVITASQPHSADGSDDENVHTRRVDLHSQAIEERWDGGISYVHEDSEGRALRTVSIQRNQHHVRPEVETLSEEATTAGLHVTELTAQGLLVLRLGDNDAKGVEEPDLKALTQAHNERLATLDPALGPVPAPSSEGERVHLPIPGGELLASWRRVETPDTEPFALYVPPVQDMLAIRATAEVPHDVMSDVLDRWAIARSLYNTPGTGVVRLATADSSTVPALLDHGFFPSTSTAIRLVRKEKHPTSPPAIVVREPRPADRGAILDLLAEMHASDVRWGGSTHFDDALHRLEFYADEALARAEGWSWVAEGEGKMVGFMSLNPPADSTWAQPVTAVSPICYFGLASVTSSWRGRGVGKALASFALRRAKDAGAAAVVLDHAATSPLASRFWHSLGFRPLWTTWHQRGPR